MNKLLSLLIIVLLGSCEVQKTTDYDRIDEFLNDNFLNHNLPRFRYMVVINEEGSCMNCNDSFSKTMALNVINDSVLFLVCTPGNSVDISGYLNGEKDNVCLDYCNKFNELNIVDHCAIIKFKLKKMVLSKK